MANRRMINKSISISLQVNRLSDFAKLLFTWMIPHADDFGRLSGEPEVVKALVVPMMKQTSKDVAKALQEMVDVGLIYWYKVDNEQVVQLIKFEEHQTGLNKRTRSKFPGPPEMSNGEIPGNSEKFPSNRTEQNLTEQKINNMVASHQKFTPPTLEEVQAYCKERNNGVDPQKWYDFYLAKNWMIGKNKMKDWRAAVRTWENNDPKNKGKPNKQYRDEWGID